MQSLIGRTFGHYRLIGQVGTGGMAVIYKAHDPILDRYVAVKVLPDYLARDADFSARFRAEARHVARLQHPNILPILSYGEEEGFHYFVMELVDGGTLKDLLGRPVALERAVTLAVQLADALQYAHEQGIVHRDVKPANVLMARPSWPRLSDFGIARVLQQATMLTRSNVFLGTPHYMSPEQARGEQAGPPTDQYALGVVLYEMLAGRPPFTADTPQALVYQHIFAEPAPIRQRNPALSEALERVLGRVLAKDPRRRYPDMGAFAAAVRAASAGTPTTRTKAEEPTEPLAVESDFPPKQATGAYATVRPEAPDREPPTVTEQIADRPFSSAPPSDRGAVTDTPHTAPPAPPAGPGEAGGRRISPLWYLLAAGALALLVAVAVVVASRVGNGGAAPASPTPTSPPPTATAIPPTTSLLNHWSVSKPTAIRVDRAGRVYVVEFYTNLLKVYANDGRTLLAKHPLGYGVTSMAIGLDGTFYVSDHGHCQVHVYSASFQSLDPLAQRGNSPGQIQCPSDVATDATGNVYVADIGDPRVEKFSPRGQYLATFGDSSLLAQPSGVAVDAQGNVYVADQGKNIVQPFAATGQHLAPWGTGQLLVPEELAVDRQGDVYVADQGTDPSRCVRCGVQLFSPSGQLLAQVADDLMKPSGVAVGPGGNLFVTDWGHDAVKVLSPFRHS